jgi:hypothetical protein
MQKLVTIYVDNGAYTDGAWLKASFADRHGFAEEHLEPYFRDGWKVVSISGFGGAEGVIARGWFAVVLEK